MPSRLVRCEAEPGGREGVGGGGGRDRECRARPMPTRLYDGRAGRRDLGGVAGQRSAAAQAGVVPDTLQTIYDYGG